MLITGTSSIEISPTELSQGFKALDPKIFACFGKGNLSYEEAQILATVSGYDCSRQKEFLVGAIFQTDEGAKSIYPCSIELGIGQACFMEYPDEFNLIMYRFFQHIFRKARHLKPGLSPINGLRAAICFGTNHNRRLSILNI